MGVRSTSDALKVHRCDVQCQYLILRGTLRAFVRGKPEMRICTLALIFLSSFATSTSPYACRVLLGGGALSKRVVL